MTGYLHPDYPRSFRHWGEPFRLPRSGAWVLERTVPDTPDRDAMGLYPLFCCSRWDAVECDLAEVGARWVTLTVVTDPFAPPGDQGWWRGFDRVVPYREHHVVRTGDGSWLEGIHPRHLKHARRALKEVEVRRVERPEALLDTWCALFEVLAGRHSIQGLRRFSREAFACQLGVPGMVAFAAQHGGEVVGLDLWYLQGPVAQGHLAAFSPLGYDLRASYATKLTILEYFADRGVEWVNLGGGNDPGLTAFKRGWTSTTLMSFLGTRVFQPERYEALCRDRAIPGREYFPAYRAGELVGGASPAAPVGGA